MAMTDYNLERDRDNLTDIAAADREARAEENLKQQVWQSLENEKQRKWQAEENLKDRNNNLECVT